MDRNKQYVVRVLHPFNAEADGEMTVKPGEELTAKVHTEHGNWLMATRDATGQSGLVPTAFVEMVREAQAAAPKLAPVVGGVVLPGGPGRVKLSDTRPRPAETQQATYGAPAENTNPAPPPMADEPAAPQKSKWEIAKEKMREKKMQIQNSEFTTRAKAGMKNLQKKGSEQAAKMKGRLNKDKDKDGGGGGGAGGAEPPTPSAQTQVFGMSLLQGVKRSNDPDCPSGLPSVVYRCVVYLDKTATDEEGIFRLSGSATKIKEYKAVFDSGQYVDFFAEDGFVDPHVVSGLLKLYFRELPNHIIPGAILNDLSAAGNNRDAQGAINAIVRLPIPNQMVLRYLFRLLIKVQRQEKINKMSSTNLGIVFTPTMHLSSGAFTIMLEQADTVFAGSDPRWVPSVLEDQEDEATNGPAGGMEDYFEPSDDEPGDDDDDDDTGDLDALAAYTNQTVSPPPEPESAPAPAPRNGGAGGVPVMAMLPTGGRGKEAPRAPPPRGGGGSKTELPGQSNDAGSRPAKPPGVRLPANDDGTSPGMRRNNSDGTLRAGAVASPTAAATASKPVKPPPAEEGSSRAPPRPVRAATADDVRQEPPQPVYTRPSGTAMPAGAKPTKPAPPAAGGGDAAPPKPAGKPTPATGGTLKRPPKPVAAGGDDDDGSTTTDTRAQLANVIANGGGRGGGGAGAGSRNVTPANPAASELAAAMASRQAKPAPAAAAGGGGAPAAGPKPAAKPKDRPLPKATTADA